MSHSSLRSSAQPWTALRHRAAIATALILCGILGLSACSSPDPAADSPSADSEAVAPSDRGTKQSPRPEASLKRLTNISAKLYDSAYKNDWQKAAQQFNRLQKVSDRIDMLSADGALEGIDVEAVLLQLDTLEEAVMAEQQVPAMVAANQLAQTGLQGTQTVNPGAKYLPMAQLAYYGRELELSALGPDGQPSGSLEPEKIETMNRAAEQVIQAWDGLAVAKDGMTTAPSGDAASGEVNTPSAAAADPRTAELENAVNTLRQAPVDAYPALARQIVVEAQKTMSNQRK
ncbi:MAG: hypothetical protein WBA10_18520 [Elainellaceae cyanobacterium]